MNEEESRRFVVKVASCTAVFITLCSISAFSMGIILGVAVSRYFQIEHPSQPPVCLYDPHFSINCSSDPFQHITHLEIENHFLASSLREQQAKSERLKDEAQYYLQKLNFMNITLKPPYPWFPADERSNYHFSVKDVQSTFEFVSEQIVYQLQDALAAHNKTNTENLAEFVVSEMLEFVHDEIEITMAKFETAVSSSRLITNKKPINDIQRQKLRDYTFIFLAHLVVDDQDKAKGNQLEQVLVPRLISKLQSNPELVDVTDVINEVFDFIPQLFDLEIRRLRCMPRPSWQFPFHGDHYNSTIHKLLYPMQTTHLRVNHVLFPGFSIGEKIITPAYVTLH
jgi:hypothetical protein